MTFEEAAKRYRDDAAFNVCVNAMVRAIEELQMSPGEMRQAAVFAEYVYQERNPVLSPDLRAYIRANSIHTDAPPKIKLTPRE